MNFVVGIDLSGPAGIANTAVTVFNDCGDRLSFNEMAVDGSDSAIVDLARMLLSKGSMTVGIDAPLSYQPGGGQRDRDADLRRAIVAVEMKPGSVMAPTAPRMVYLTLRGIALAAVLARTRGTHPMRIVEVHPGATMGLRGAPLNALLKYGRDQGAQRVLLEWLSTQGLEDIPSANISSHFVAASACALAAWNWQRGNSRWLAAAEEPWHPYDFAC